MVVAVDPDSDLPFSPVSTLTYAGYTWSKMFEVLFSLNTVSELSQQKTVW